MVTIYSCKKGFMIIFIFNYILIISYLYTLKHSRINFNKKTQIALLISLYNIKANLKFILKRNSIYFLIYKNEKTGEISPAFQDAVSQFALLAGIFSVFTVSVPALHRVRDTVVHDRAKSNQHNDNDDSNPVSRHIGPELEDDVLHVRGGGAKSNREDIKCAKGSCDCYT